MVRQGGGDTFFRALAARRGTATGDGTEPASQAGEKPAFPVVFSRRPIGVDEDHGRPPEVVERRNAEPEPVEKKQRSSARDGRE